MNQTIIMVLSLIAGTALGLFFYGGLWWTVRHLTANRKAGVLFVTSWLLRNVLTIAGFYLITGGQMERLLFCLGGFIIARQLVIQYTRRGEYVR